MADVVANEVLKCRALSVLAREAEFQPKKVKGSGFHIFIVKLKVFCDNSIDSLQYKSC